MSKLKCVGIHPTSICASQDVEKVKLEGIYIDNIAQQNHLLASQGYRTEDPDKSRIPTQASQTRVDTLELESCIG